MHSEVAVRTRAETNVFTTCYADVTLMTIRLSVATIDQNVNAHDYE